ncbi:hypothetical protein OIE71_19860 [Streptomyces sp. NBC_01725]|uniref:hypothetical protein n=1 Tax=Streptomyces sp. NBC_01725 TaxID=2975923 RepID=UPI002E27DD31|nr:hypothetical protein [Streptomyces sp. NBC_01725]
MREFIDAALGFPTFLFTAALIVVIGFWLLVLTGVAETDSFDSDVDLDAAGIGGVPVTVAFSLLTALAWFSSLAASVTLHRFGAFDASGLVRATLTLTVLAGSALLAWRATRLLVRPLHTLFPDEPGPSRLDFVGLTCTIRTGRVDAWFGQAEVAARDGSTAVVQVRQHRADMAKADAPVLGNGSTGLLYAYDEAGEFFWVAPYDTALDPRASAA